MPAKPPIPNPIVYLLDSFQNLNMFVTGKLNQLPYDIKRILNRTLTSGDYSLGNTDIAFFNNVQSSVVSFSKTLTKEKPTASFSYSATIPENDNSRYKIQRFSSDFNIGDTKIISGEWQFFIPCKLIGSGTVFLIVEVKVQDTNGDQTLLFTTQSPTSVSPNDYAILNKFIRVEGILTTNPADILIIDIFAIGLNTTENIIVIENTEELPLYFVYPKETIDEELILSRLDTVDGGITNLNDTIVDLNTTIDNLTTSVNNLKGGLHYQSDWNANTNTPALPTPSNGNKGYYWIVKVEGNTDIDGETDWKVNDWVVSNGVTYTKYDNTPTAVSVPSATTIIEGKSRRATNLEITEGTNDTTHVSPAGLLTWLVDKLSNDAFGTVYATLEKSLPSGGTLGQFLTKTSTGAYSSVWSSIKTFGNTVLLGNGDILNDASVHTTVLDTDKIIFVNNTGNLFTAEVSKLKELIFAGGTLTGELNFNNNIINNAIFKNCSSSQLDHGTSSATATVSIDVSVAHTHLMTCGGAHTLTFDFTGWDTTDVTYMELILTNMGLGTFACLDTIQWKKPDDTYTTNFATYITARGGEATLKTSGVDSFLFEYINGTLYGTLL